MVSRRREQIGQKGFTMVQIDGGLYPDMSLRSLSRREQAGFPLNRISLASTPRTSIWRTSAFSTVDHVWLPVSVGFWDISSPHGRGQNTPWRYLSARWGAYPVVLCLAGEGDHAPTTFSKPRNRMLKHKNKRPVQIRAVCARY